MNPTAGFLAGASQDLRDTVHAGSLEVDRAPVTNARYARFVAATGHRPPLYWPQGTCPATLLDHPVVGVDLFDALAFARWAGGALPTELQWVQATGLAEPRAYVWGDAFEPERCNTYRSGIKGTAPVGAHPSGTAPSGCVDMCGNVWELTCSPHVDDPMAVLVKGGSWYDYPVHAKIDASFRAGLNRCLATVGFRLVYGVEPRLPPAIDDEGLVEECIAFRRAGRGTEGELGGGGEFEEVLAALRERAEEYLPGLDLESGSVPPSGAVQEALALFDMAEEDTAEEAPSLPQTPSLRRQIAAAATALRLRQGAGAVFRRGRAAWNAFRSSRGRPWRDRARDAAGELRATQAARSIWARLRDAAAAWHAAPDPRVFERTWSFLRERPAVAMLGACVAAGILVGLLGAAVSSRGAAPRTAHVDAPLPPPRADPVVVRRVAPRSAAHATAPPVADAHAVPDAGDAVETAIRDLLDGNGHRRDEAEGFLIGHADESFDRVRNVMGANLPATALASLRYVFAAIEEERASPVAPTSVLAPPSRGLVLFLDHVDANAEQYLAMVRHTARAERMAFTVSLVTDEETHAAIKRHGKAIGGADLYVDTGGQLVDAGQIKQLPAVVAHGPDGRVAFLLYGAVPRHRLAECLARLKP